MTDIVELMNRMSSTFNSDCATSTAEGGMLLNSDLAEDKTLKWRNLANNQFACKDKDKKQAGNVEKQQELPTAEAATEAEAAAATENEEQKLPDAANVKMETEATVAAAEADKQQSPSQLELQSPSQSQSLPQGQSHSQSQSQCSDGANAASAEITQIAAAAEAAADESTAAAAAEADANAETETSTATDGTKLAEAAASTAATPAAAETTTTPNEATAAAAVDNGVDDDDEVAEHAAEVKGDGDGVAGSDDNAAVTTKAANVIEEEEEAEAAITTTTTAVKLEQEAFKSAAATTTATTIAAVEQTTTSVAAATVTTTTTTTNIVTTNTTSEGIKTENEMETANAKPKEELLDEQQQQQQQQQQEQQQQQPSKEQTLTAQPEPSADAATVAAVVTAEVTASSPVTTSSSASPTLSLAAVAPLVVNAADVADGAADATDSTAMNAAGSSSSDVAAAAPTTAEAATLAADKNEQIAAGSTRRLRRTPRPTDEQQLEEAPQQREECNEALSNNVKKEEVEKSPAANEEQMAAATTLTTATSTATTSTATTTTTTSAAALNVPPAPKRGRGRAKKIKPEVEATDLAQASSELPAVEETTVERKVGRKRKLPEEDQQQQHQQQQQQLTEMSSVVVKTEQEEDASTSSAAAAAAPMRRSVRLGNRHDHATHASWSSEEVKTEPMASQELTPTMDTLPGISGASGVSGVAGVLDEKTPPKKRGRKAKIPAVTRAASPALGATTTTTTATAISTTSGSNNSGVGASSSSLSNGNKRAASMSVTTTSTTSSNDVQLPKRSKRRIKPTPKILENDALRSEFETKFIERISHWEAAGGEGADTVHFETPLQFGSAAGSNSSTSRQKSDKSDGGTSGAGAGAGAGAGDHPAGTSAIKKRLFSKSQRDIDNSGAALLAKSLLPPCPDLEQFISDIKAAKLNANRSPEERKLNKKQQRKLAKQKEKHLKHLGLRRNNSEEASDNDSSNTDNEEFVPTTRVQVGKPSVTLRLRNATKDTATAAATTTATVTTTGRTTTNAAAVALPPPIPAPTPTPSGKLSRRIGVRNNASGAGATGAGASGSATTTLDHAQLQALNSAILSAAHDASDAIASTSAAAAAAAVAVKFICLCQKSSPYYAPNAPDASYCCAIDNIDEQKIGCCNELSAGVHNLLRPSQRVGYMILCDEHKKRLQSHNCCAGCGIFCTQGKFVLCKQQHFFHPDCAQRFILNSPYDAQQQQQHSSGSSNNINNNYASPLLVLKCPHCGLDTPERTSTVTMKCQTLPVFLPAQKTKIKPAKLTTSSHLTQFGTASGSNKPPGSTSSTAKGASGGTRGKAAAAATAAGKSNGTRGSNGKVSTTTTTSSGLALNIINFEQLIPESVMNVVQRGRMVSSSGRVTTEFNTRDMYYAVQNDDLERVAEILAADYNVLTRMREFLNGTCLHLVAHSGTLQMAYLLLCKGASSEDFVNIVDSELRTALMCAVTNDKCDMLNLFLQCGADVAIKGPDGMTSLHIAAKLGNLDAAQLIVDSYRASRNISNFLSFIDAQDEGGWTAMVWAAELGHTDIVSLLINHGADANICDNDNNTVLHWSTLHNDGLETITVLLQAGADCNVQNVEGDTPLHIACRHSVTRMCIALIANGADLMIKNKAEQLPFDCIPNEESECGRTVGFNMQMRSFRPLGLRTRVVCADASNGRELRPIQAVRNELTMSEHEDEADALMWPDFKYITNCIILQNPVQIDRRVSQMRICSCLDSCSSDLCQCNGASSQNWYTAESRLNCDFNYDDPAVIFECNDVCGCNQLSCKNRVVQNGTRTPLQIVECEEPAKGWGVRALANVPKGTYVASYTGEILTAPEADRRTDDSYYFDLDNGHCIDANYYGNVSRFFNHSCEANILPVRVFYEHQDYRFPKIAFFACRDIDAGEEICYDYGEKFWRAEQRATGGGCRCLTTGCKYSLHATSSNTSPTVTGGDEEAPTIEAAATSAARNELCITPMS
ncbi:platelet binding protein GspB [Drosophila innubila]|uniref:platelet binding protein GspB n=1 Tax=Drosophila innubila TaxID=198719 RepID=UPI00148D5DCC|nr:platelet binding protein GspB [Drosophila innubila]